MHLVPSCQTVSNCFANPAVLPQKAVSRPGCSINAARLIKWIRCISFTRVYGDLGRQRCNRNENRVETADAPTECSGLPTGMWRMWKESSNRCPQRMNSCLNPIAINHSYTVTTFKYVEGGPDRKAPEVV